MAQVYLNPNDKSTEVMKGMSLQSKEVPMGSKYYYEVLPVDANHVITSESRSENDKYHGIPEEYVLPPREQTSIQTWSHVRPQQADKRRVADLYDEDHYALPNIDGCITERFGVLKDVRDEEQQKQKPKEKKQILATKKMTIIGFIILFILSGGITAIFLTVFLGRVPIFISQNMVLPSCCFHGNSI
jgi:hypothetical protein